MSETKQMNYKIWEAGLECGEVALITLAETKEEAISDFIGYAEDENILDLESIHSFNSVDYQRLKERIEKGRIIILNTIWDNNELPPEDINNWYIIKIINPDNYKLPNSTYWAIEENILRLLKEGKDIEFIKDVFADAIAEAIENAKEAVERKLKCSLMGK